MLFDDFEFIISLSHNSTITNSLIDQPEKFPILFIGI